MTQNNPIEEKPHILIVGAGIGGLMLAILLEQINIPYQIFERASEVKPLGKTTPLQSNHIHKPHS